MKKVERIITTIGIFVTILVLNEMFHYVVTFVK